MLYRCYLIVLFDIKINASLSIDRKALKCCLDIVFYNYFIINGNVFPRIVAVAFGEQPLSP